MANDHFVRFENVDKSYDGKQLVVKGLNLDSYSLDDSKLRNLGWSPVTVFDEEITEIVKYYKDNFVW